MSLKSRVDKLEGQVEAGGGFEVVGVGEFDLTREELAQREEEARQRVGPGGTVIAVQYVKDWRVNRDAETSY